MRPSGNHIILRATNIDEHHRGVIMAEEPPPSLLPIQRTPARSNGIAPLNEGDSAVMEALRRVLIEHGAIDRFGITLLHSHFDLDEDEALLEESDAEQRLTTIRPHKGLLPDGFVETAWRFSPASSGPQAFLGCRGEWYWDYSTNPPTYRYRHWGA